LQEPKKRSGGAAERDEFLRSLWRTDVGRIDPVRLVFVDEMGTHTSLAPLYAYAPVGERAFFEVPRNRGKNTTLLTSLHARGMGPSMAVEGPTTASVFETYVKRLLAPALRPGQVVVMDNLGAHRPKRVRELIERRGCELLYLPPYSPDLNPIEGAFRGGQAHPQEDPCPHQGGLDRGDGPSVGSRECPRRRRVLRSLRLPHTGAAAMKGAVRGRK
jgi:DDE superfamily endonuclease